jgi:hypothetical protein
VHAYIDAGALFIVNKADEFDFAGYHPNIEAIRTTPHKAAEYAEKDGDVFFRQGTPPSSGSGPDKWKTIMDQPTRDEFFAKAKELAPRETLLHWNSLKAFADDHYTKQHKQYEDPGIPFNIPNELSEWLQSNIVSHPARPRSLVIWGDTRIGKTLWARSLGRHLYFPGFFSLDRVSEEAEYAIFDDLVDGFTGMSGYKGWIGGEMEVILTDKYRSKKHIHWGKPSIFITNEDPSTLPGVDHNWLEGNCTTNIPMLEQRV